MKSGKKARGKSWKVFEFNKKSGHYEREESGSGKDGHLDLAQEPGGHGI